MRRGAVIEDGSPRNVCDEQPLCLSHVHTCLCARTHVHLHTLLHAPTAVVSWQHYKDEIHWPIIHTREERPDLDDREVLATVPAGSVFAYSTRTYHRGTAMQGEGGRLAHFISYAPKNCPWLGIVSWPIQGVKKSYHRWIESSTIEER